MPDINAIRQYFKNIVSEPVMVAFSGGADSVLVLKLALEAAQGRFPVYALYANAPWMPKIALAEAKQIADDFQATFEVVDIGSAQSIGIEDNPRDRCYLCKKAIFKRFLDFGHAHHVNVLLDGTQLDDLKKYRPGLKAIAESGARSPLKELGLGKSAVRELLAYYKLSVAKKPSGSCLATRLPYGERLSSQLFDSIEQAENTIRSLNLGTIRVRSHGEIARVEVDSDCLTQAIALREKIVEPLKALGWKYITLDLEGFRSGSMD